MGFLDDIKAGKQLKKTPKATEKKTLAAAETHLAEAAAAREQYDAKVADCAKKLPELKGDEHGSHQQRLEDRLTRLKDVDLAACQESTSEVSAAIGSKNAEVKKAMQLEKKAAFALKDLSLIHI